MSVKGFLSPTGAVLIGANALYGADGSKLAPLIGEISVVPDSDTANNWVASGAGVTVATTTTSTDLPLAGVVNTAIKITPVSSTDYARYRWTMPASLKGTKLKVQWNQRPLSGYASGDLKVEVYKNAASNYGGAYTEFALSTDASGTSAIPNATQRYVTTFDADDADYYELRIVRVTGTTALNICQVVIGPGVQPQGFAGSEWQSYTPTSAMTANTTMTGRYRRVGDSVDVQFKAAFAGAPTSTTFTCSVPTGLTIDTSKLPSGASNTGIIGNAVATDAGTGYYNGHILYNNSTSVQCGGDDGVASWTQAVPFTFGNGDAIEGEFTVPIAEWAGSGTINVVQNDVEYAYNSSTSTTANDTTSFAYGPAGAQIQNITATLDRTVRFQTPIQPTDQLFLEVSNDRLVWRELSQLMIVNSGDVAPLSVQNAGIYGAGLRTQVSTTDVTVRFGQYSAPSGATFGAAGGAWSTGGGSGYWRLRKAAAGAAVGFGLATTTSSGLVNPYTVGSGVVYSGQYTPTLTNTTNIDSSTSGVCNYMRVGNMVTVTGNLTVDTTAAASTYTEMGVSLPIASSIAASSDISGTVTCDAPVGTPYAAGGVSGNPSDDRCYFTWNSNRTVPTTVYFTFMYKII